MQAEKVSINDFDINPGDLPPGTFYIPPVGKKPGCEIPEVPYISPDIIRWDKERRKRPEIQVPLYDHVPDVDYGPHRAPKDQHNPAKSERGVDIIYFSNSAYLR